MGGGGSGGSGYIAIGGVQSSDLRLVPDLVRQDTLWRDYCTGAKHKTTRYLYR